MPTTTRTKVAGPAHQYSTPDSLVNLAQVRPNLAYHLPHKGRWTSTVAQYTSTVDQYTTPFSSTRQAFFYSLVRRNLMLILTPLVTVPYCMNAP